MKKYKPSPFIITGVVVFLLWSVYVIFSENIVRAFCDRRSTALHQIEMSDIVFIGILILLILLVIIGIFVSFIVSLIRVSKKSPAAPLSIKKKEHSRKELVFGIISTFLCLVVLLVLWFIRYRSYVTHLESYAVKNSPTYREPEAPALSSEDMLLLGWAHYRDAHPENSYILFPEKKKPGTIRIGIFGCSFVHGSEVAMGNEFPTFLHRMFRDAGAPNIEVINFGVDGYGLNQAYMMWERVGRRYELDHVVFLPLEIHESRDRTFVYQNRNYVPVHGRYILGKDDVKLIGVEGKNTLDATRRYFGFIPPWRYLRYDEKAPVSLFSLLPDKSRELFNPLYYKPRSKRKNEILDIYSCLFRHLGAEARNAVVIVEDEDFREVEKKTSAPHLVFIDSCAGQYRSSFLYKAPGGHHSAMGQRIQAEELFDFLTGKDRAAFPYMEIQGSDKAPSGLSSAQPLCLYSSISAGIEGTPVAHFGLPTETGVPDPRCMKVLDFRNSNVASLLQQTEGKLSRFLPLPFMLKDGASLTLNVKTRRREYRVPIGTVNAAAGIIGTASISSKQCYLAHGQTRITPSAELDSTEMPNTITVEGVDRRIVNLSLSVDDNFFLTGDEIPWQKVVNTLRRAIVMRPHTFLIHRFQLKPLACEYSYLKSGAGEYIDVEKLTKREGTLDLLLTDEKGKTSVVPTFLNYTLKEAEGAPFRSVYKDCITVPEKQETRQKPGIAD
ncbi:MAG: hypothetical protein AB9903_34780 [Vulcanimicrobiota bacterium]